MNYTTGEKIMLGDFVSIGSGMDGIVVYDYESGRCHPEFESWSTLGCGVLVRSRQVGMVHYLEPDMDLELKNREAEGSVKFD